MKSDYKNIIPKRFHDVSYETDVPDEIKKIVLDQIKKSDGIYIWGTSGVGKTHIVCALCKYILDDGFDVLFYNTGEFLEKLRNEFNGDDDGLLRKVMDFKGILVLDDIGAEKPTDWTRERLYLVLNKRYEDMLPVIFTSNCNLSMLVEQVGDRITSRIAGMTSRYEISGKDYRVRK